MTRLELVQKVKNRKKQLGITIDNLAKLNHLGVRTVNRFFANEDVRFSTIEKITNTLGLDFSGNEVIIIDELKKQQAKQKAIFMTSLVQGTSSLELQGIDEKNINNMIVSFEKEFLEGSYKNRLWVA